MKNSVRSTWSWSASLRPEIIAAGRYPVVAKSRGFLRRPVEHVVLHHHGYEGAAYIGGHRFDLLPGDLTLTPTRTESLYDLPGEGFHQSIHFQPADGDGNEETQLLSVPLHFRPGLIAGSIGQRIAWITDLHRQARHADPRRRTLALATASAALQELILTLSLLHAGDLENEPASAKVETAVQTVVNLIETRLREPLSVPALANEAQLSQNYLARAFRARYGTTVPNYVLRRRIELAEHLLTTSRHSIKEVAAEVGLADIQHFNKQFRRLVGVSPSVYREEQSRTLCVAA